MMNENVINEIRENKIIAIVRGAEPDKCVRVAEALYAGGIRLMEITYDQRDRAGWGRTGEAIAAVARAFGGRMSVGAGTVTNTELTELTAKSGGRFVISPNTNESVIRRTKELGMVSIPGAMTPTEILAAHDAGADMVKLFPASELGLGYLKAIRAPLNHIEIVACGGITDANARDYLNAGAAALGISSGIVKASYLNEERYELITAAAKKLTEAVK